MKNRLSFALVLGLAAFLAGCQGPCDKIEPITAPNAGSGSADFSNYVALGTSISAGFQSGGLVYKHQATSFPALFAQLVGKSVLASGQGQFSFPAVSANGYPPLLHLRSIKPLLVDTVGYSAFGEPTNATWPTAYNNLAVPTATMLDVVDSTNYYATVAPPAGLGRSPGAFFFFENAARHRGALLTQAISLGPTFMSLELGANELLGYATAGGYNSAVFPPGTYAALLTSAVNGIHTFRPDAKIALFTPPNPTTIPYFKTFSPYTIRLSDGAPAPLLGPSGALSATDLVLLTAKDSLARGTGFAVGTYNYLNPAAPGNGRPLPDWMVLNTSEQSNVTAAWTAMSIAIDSVSQRPFVTKVDLNQLLETVATNGLTVGTTHYTTAYITGGLFSLDGIHPNDLAHALICNSMVDAVNAKFGAGLPRLNLAQYASLSASRMRPVGEDPLHAYEGLEIQGLDERRLGMLRIPR